MFVRAFVRLPLRVRTCCRCMIFYVQVPGSPVINLVQIYALPAHAAARLSSSDDKKFLAMFRRYCDGLPVVAANRAHPPSTQCAPEVGAEGAACRAERTTRTKALKCL